jgi:hypothetical protein
VQIYDKNGLGKSECALINYHGAEFAQLPLLEAFYISELNSSIWKLVPHHVFQLKITELRIYTRIPFKPTSCSLHLSMAVSKNRCERSCFWD